MSNLVVVDTNVMVSALLKPDSAPRNVLRSCLDGRVTPLMGNALLSEIEAVYGRDSLFKQSPLSIAERRSFLDDFLSLCQWVSVYYLWRPNLRDEADNHLVELAVAGGANSIVTGNTGDFENSVLLFPGITVLTPTQFVLKLEN